MIIPRPRNAHFAACHNLGESNMRKHSLILVLLASGLTAAMLAMIWPDKRMVSRDIGCEAVASARGKQICTSLSKSMEWTWLGHAIVSPGWRVTWKSLGTVYCRQKINAADLPALEAMRMSSDWRLQDGADNLIRLVQSSTGLTSEPENSIFNPANPQYLLKNGCGNME